MPTASLYIATSPLGRLSDQFLNTKFQLNVSVNGLADNTDLFLYETIGSDDDLVFTSNGTLAFSTKRAAGSAYNVAVKKQPDNQTCTVESAAGTVIAETTVSVVCANNTGTSYLFSVSVTAWKLEKM